MPFNPFKKKGSASDFKPDVNPSTFAKTARLTRLQKQQLTKWGLYISMCLLCAVTQDVLMSQLRLFGATTDLGVCVILLIAMVEGSEPGSLFLLLASTVYYFTGSPPSAYCIGLTTALGIGATLLRQMYLHRSKGSIVVCTGIAMVLYEIGLFIIGILSGRTIWIRLPVFLFTGLYSALALIPLYSVIEKISMIGGNTWKE